MPTEPILEIQGLTWEVDSQRLVDDISLSIPPEHMIAIVGPSGAGKSSFLRLLNRLNEPTAGRILLEGVDYATLPPQELRRRVGMMMQTPYMFPGTVTDNIAYGPAQRGETLPTSRIAHLLTQVDLEGFAERDASTLSVGEAQRISLARILANEPRLLLLDEPTSALDQTAVASAEQLLKQVIRDNRLTCLIITHDLDQARRLADLAIHIRRGQLAHFGPIEEVINAVAMD